MATGTLTLAALGGVPEAQAHRAVTVTGAFVCNDRGVVRPLSGARVHLREDRPYGFSERLTRSYTRPDGSFSMTFDATEEDHPRFFVRVFLKSPEKVTLSDWWMIDEYWSADLPTRWSKRRRTHRTSLEEGTWELAANGGRSTPKCAIWQGARHAWTAFASTVGSDPPINDDRYAIEADIPCCGSPWTTLNATHWPPGHRTRPREEDPGQPDVGDYRTSWHEFAHAVRHSLDGDGSHFGRDTVEYNYPRNHFDCFDSNLGFAFNEGWAEYWAWDNGGCGNNPNPMTVEGNVARELKCLEDQSDRPTMVRVLRENPRSIHSYEQFETRWEAIVGRAASSCVVTPAGAVTHEITPIRDIRADAQRDLQFFADYVQRLRREEAGITPVRPGERCRQSDCADVAQRLLRPVGARARMEQASLIMRAIRKALKDLDRHGLRYGPDPALLESIDSARAALRKRNLSALARRYDQAALRLGPFRHRHPTFRTELLEIRRLASRIRALQRGRMVSLEDFELGLPAVPDVVRRLSP